MHNALVSMTPHWALLALLVALASYTSAIATNLRNTIRGLKSLPQEVTTWIDNQIDSEDVKSKPEVKKWLEAKQQQNDSTAKDRHQSDLYGLICIEVGLILLAIVTMLRIAVPLFKMNSEYVQWPLGILAGSLALGALISFIAWCGTNKKTERKSFWWWSAFWLFIFTVVAVAGLLAEPWDWSAYPTSAQVDVFLLAGFLAIIGYFTFLHGRQWFRRLA